MKKVILLGGGSHCKSVIDTLFKLPGWEIVGILDVKEKVGFDVKGVKVIGEDSELSHYYNSGIEYAFVTAGGVGDNALRIILYNKAKSIGFKMPTFVDPTSVVSESAEISEGTFIGKGTIINTDAKIGENCIINTGAIVEHDGNIQSHCHLAPGTTLSGGVHIGQGAHIGTNTTIIQGIEIGENTLIGAGSVVVKNIAKNQKAYGNPCKVV